MTIWQYDCQEKIEIGSDDGGLLIINETNFCISLLIFKFAIDACRMRENSSGLYLTIDDSSVVTLAAGWSIAIVAEVHFKTLELESGLLPTERGVMSANRQRFYFSGITSKMSELIIKLHFTFDDVHPYRELHMSEAIARMQQADATLIITESGDTRIYVNKNELARNSSFFEELFFVGYNAWNNSQFLIPNVSVDDFLEYIYCVTVPTRPFKLERMRTILSLATRFRNDMLLAEAESYLQKIDKETYEKKKQVLLLAGEFGYMNLFRNVLSLIKPEELHAFENTQLPLNEECRSLCLMHRRELENIRQITSCPTSSALPQLPKLQKLFEVADLVGRGAIGKVFRSWDPRTRKVCAIKVVEADQYQIDSTGTGVSHDPSSNNDPRNTYLHEVRILAALAHHQNVVQLYQWWIESVGRTTYLVLCMEYCKQSLDSALQNGYFYLSNQLAQQQVDFILRGVLSGVIYIHSARVIHRDIKPENILITSDGVVKIADFDNATYFSVTRSMTNGRGTQAYMAPEISSSSNYNYKVDVFSTGVLIYETYARLTSEDTSPLRQSVLDIMNNGRFPDDFGSGIDEIRRNVIKTTIAFALAELAENRPSSSQLKTLFQ